MTIFLKAIYNDGTFFKYSEDNEGSEDYYKIDRIKLIAFELWLDDKSLVHRVNIEPNQRLIYRRRVAIKMGMDIMKKVLEYSDDPREQQNYIRKLALEGKIPTIVVYVTGYQETIKGVNSQSLVAIYEDGHTEQFSKWKEAPLDNIPLIELEK